MRIRLATGDDAAAIAAIYRPYVLETPITFEIDPPDDSEMRTRVIDALAAHAWIVAEDAGRIVGYAYGSAHAARLAYRWSVNVSVYLHPSVHRRGIGRGLYTSLLAILSAQGYAMAYAGITLPNMKSVGVHEAMGFRPVGVYHSAGFKLGQWHDVGWWERPLAPAVASPPPVRPAAGLEGLSQLLASGVMHIR